MIKYAMGSEMQDASAFSYCKTEFPLGSFDTQKCVCLIKTGDRDGFFSRTG